MDSNNTLFAMDGFQQEVDFDFLLVHPDDKAISHWELVYYSDADDDSDRIDAVNEVSVDGNPTTPSVVQYPHRDANPNPIDHAGVMGCDFGGSLGADHSDGGVDDEEIEDGLDDELVPRYLGGKLGRERIRKLGKRGCSKMNSSKKSPFLYMKPGCLHGKHGFGIGLKNSL